MQILGQLHIFQALVEIPAESQVYKAARQSHTIQAVIEIMTKSQAPKIAW